MFFLIEDKRQLPCASFIFIHSKILSFLWQPFSLYKENSIVKIYCLKVAPSIFVDYVKWVNNFLFLNVNKVEVENFFRYFVFK